MEPIDMKTKLATLRNDLASRAATTLYERQVQAEALSKTPAGVTPTAYPKSGIEWPESESAPQAPLGYDIDKVEP
jgi:hypothetical protein